VGTAANSEVTSPSASRERPASYDEAAAQLRRYSEQGVSVFPVGAGTKLGWGGLGEPAPGEISTERMTDVIEHNEGDLTAVLDAGAPLAAIQAMFAEAGQMLALDPPLGADDAATIGGVVATGDSGPLRHRYGAPRDLILGMTIALPDGTISKSGGRVIKNVAGYDVAKLLAGSFGTLGLILQVVVRLHPLRPRMTLRLEASDPNELGTQALTLSHSHLEMESLDANWSGGSGAVLARFAGAAAEEQASAARDLIGGGEVVVDDAPLWAAQRSMQRSATGTVVRVSGQQSDLPRVAQAAEGAGAALVGRAALGISWLALEALDDEAAVDAVGELRDRLGPSPCVVLDAPTGVRSSLDVWDEDDRGRLALARRVKERFDPQRVMRPGIFVGGI
jgi:glycolate oxidase FAD binding subunit